MKQFIFQSSITNKSIKEETKNKQKTSKKGKKTYENKRFA